LALSETQQAATVVVLPPEIRFKRAILSSDTNMHLGFEVHNPNGVPLFVFGYMRDSFNPPVPDDQIPPIIFTAEVKSDGQWKPHTCFGYCAFGQGSVELPPGRSVDIGGPPPTDDWDAFRIGIDWRSPNESGVSHRTWSEPVTYAKIIP
jgi:hypothetical protein